MYKVAVWARARLGSRVLGSSSARLVRFRLELVTARGYESLARTRLVSSGYQKRISIYLYNISYINLSFISKWKFFFLNESLQEKNIFPDEVDVQKH